MTEPNENTDAGYANSRRKAEQTFFLASVDWLERVVREAEKLPKMPKPDVRKIVAEAFAAGLRGEEMKLEKPPKRRFSSDLILNLVETRHKYGEAELRAYPALLERKGVPPSQAVPELEQHAEETLGEIHKRKRTRNIEENVTGLFDNEPWIEGSGHFVEDRIREFVHDDLHNWVWFHQDGWA
jgi:hypothetical protein